MAIDPRDPEFLLERSERVRALARHLLGLPDGAEDVAQDALVASLGWTDPGDETLPARLAAHVRSLAGRWRRSNARRVRREAAAARPDRAPSADELCERAALQRTLVEAVLALEEPYRECVILRWFEGLPPRAIAELRSLPVRTVQTRLARALTQLRARLERRVDLSAWVPLLVPLAVQPTTYLPFPSSALGALAVAHSKLVSAVIGVVLIGSTVLVLRHEGQPVSPESRTVSIPSTHHPLGVGASAAGTRELDEVGSIEARAEASPANEVTALTEEWAPDRDLDLFGEVVDVYGQPLAGVELNALEPEPEPAQSLCEPSRGGVVLASTHSDREGRFQLRLEPGRQCTLEAILPGMAGVRLSERRAGERVRVVLGPPATLWGRVTRTDDATGVAEAHIRLRLRPLEVTTRMVCFEAVTDSGGAYAFAGLPAGHFDVEVTGASYPGLQPPQIVLSAGQTLERDFVVPGGVDVAGRVVDASTGLGIAGAEVSLHPFFAGSARTEADGGFLLRGWDMQAQGVSVHARAEGYALASHALPRGQAPEGAIEIALAGGAAISGRILSPTGAPQPDALVEVHGSRGSPDVRRDRASARSGPDGRFEIGGLSRDQAHTLVASAPGAGRLIVDLPDFDPARDPRDLGDLDLPVASSLAGRVVDADGRPLPNAYVTLQGGDPGRNRLRAPEQEPLEPITPVLILRLDDLGRFRAIDLSRGDYMVSARVTGMTGEAQAEVHLREGEALERLELVLDLGLRITGRITGPDGEPIALAIVSAVPSGGGFEGRTGMNSRADGSFELAGLTSGEWVVTVDHFANSGGRRYCSARVDGVAADTSDLNIVLPEADEVSGVVLAADGTPLPDATVQVDHGDGRVGGFGAALCDANGSFRLLVPAGVPVDLLAADWRNMAEGSAGVKLGRIQGIEPGTSDLTIRIEP